MESSQIAVFTTVLVLILAILCAMIVALIKSCPSSTKALKEDRTNEETDRIIPARSLRPFPIGKVLGLSIHVWLVCVLLPGAFAAALAWLLTGGREPKPINIPIERFRLSDETTHASEPTPSRQRSDSDTRPGIHELSFRLPDSRRMTLSVEFPPAGSWDIKRKDTFPGLVLTGTQRRRDGEFSKVMIDARYLSVQGEADFRTVQRPQLEAAIKSTFPSEFRVGVTDGGETTIGGLQAKWLLVEVTSDLITYQQKTHLVSVERVLFSISYNSTSEFDQLAPEMERIVSSIRIGVSR